MATEKRVYSDLAIPPGEYLAEVIRSKNMTQAELARRTGRPVQAINEIVKGEKALTPETALQLERALGVPAHIWTGLESRYRLIKAKEEERKLIQRELPYLQKTPYKQLAEIGCVARSRKREFKVRELHRFYGVSSLANLRETWVSAPAFRRSPKWDASSYALAAWLRCAELRAFEISAEPFDRTELKKAMGDFRSWTTRSPEEFLPDLRRRLADCGVALALLPHFPKTYANGATFWLSAEKAVLALSIRGRWADIFWFSLFHEVGHLVLHKRTMFVDDGDVPPGRRGLEKEANKFAAESLIPEGKLRAFIEIGSFEESSVRDFATELGIAPGIVVGRLQHEGAVKQDSELNRLRERYEWSGRP